MAPISYKASAPGSLMLLGEHAVLYDRRAMVLAINKRVTVTLTPHFEDNLKDKVLIESALGTLAIDLKAIESCNIQKPFQFVLAAILQSKNNLVASPGFTLKIVSDFESHLGLGSSAAVTVATVAVLEKWIVLNRNIKNEDADIETESPLSLFKKAKAVILQVQGVGSGADVAASVYGGIVVYQKNAPYILKHIPHLPPLVALYSGYKTPTVQVIQKVAASYQKNCKIFDKVFDAMERCTLDAIDAVQNEDWHLFGEICNIHHGLMNAIGISNAHLNQLAETLNAESSILGAKISGSGLGDCVIGIGTLNDKLKSLEWVQNISLQGSVYGVNVQVEHECC